MTVIDKRTMFMMRLSKNLAKIEDDEERRRALGEVVKPGAQNLVNATVKAMVAARR